MDLLYNEYIIPGEKSSLSNGTIEVTILKLTGYGITQVQKWIDASLIKKDGICPFSCVCIICSRIFGEDFKLDRDMKRRGECPCREYGVEACTIIAEETIRYSWNNIKL